MNCNLYYFYFLSCKNICRVGSRKIQILIINENFEEKLKNVFEPWVGANHPATSVALLSDHTQPHPHFLCSRCHSHLRGPFEVPSPHFESIRWCLNTGCFSKANARGVALRTAVITAPPVITSLSRSSDSSPGGATHGFTRKDTHTLGAGHQGAPCESKLQEGTKVCRGGLEREWGAERQE